MERLQQILSFLFSTERYTSLVEKDRARTIYGIGAVLLVLTTPIITLVPLGDEGQSFVQQAGDDSIFTLALIAFYTLTVGSFILTRIGWLRWGAFALSLTWAFSFNVAAVQGGLYVFITGVGLVIQILLAGLLLGNIGLIVGLVATAAAVIMGFSARATAPLPTFDTPAVELAVFTFLLAIIIGIVYMYLRFSRLSREEGVNEALAERLKLAEMTTQITRRISSRNALQDVFDNTIEQIISNYDDVYHAQIFMIDDTGQTARLVASTGEVGQRLLERQHSLGVGSKSVIGRVTSEKRSVVARARALDTVHRRNEYLPDTLVEAAFPLLSGDRVIGALDLQSKKPGAFPDYDLPLYQTLADHIAIAIDNARLFEEARTSVEENRRLAEQRQSALREVERLNMRLTGHAWTEFLQGKTLSGLSVDFDDHKVEPAGDWTEHLQAAINANHVIHEGDSERQVVAVPLRVRGQTIGAMEFELDENGQLSTEDLDMVQEISERFGLAVETARLYEESQRSAQREALINEISAKLQASNNVETTLNEAARSLQRTLKANRVSIRLGAPETREGSGNGHSNGGEA